MSQGTGIVSGDAASAREPLEVTVVVVDPTGPAGQACLDSWRSQALGAERRELVAVHTATAAIDPARQARNLTVAGATHAAAVQAGLWAARGRYVVLADETQVASPGLLQWLLSAQSAGVVPVARTAGASAGRAQSRLAISPSGALLPTGLARSMAFNESAEDGAVAAHLFGLWRAEGFELREADDSDDAWLRPADEGAVTWSATLDALQGALRLRPEDPESRRLRRTAVEAVAAELREALVEHPETQGKLVGEVRRRRIRRMPWDLVNRGRARQLGLLFCFPPALDTSGLVAARRLEELGHVTDVVSQDLAHLRPVDEDSLRVAAPYLDELRVVPGDRRFDNWASVRTWTQAALEQVGELEARKGPYERMYSRSMSLQSHVAAAVLKLRRPELPWIAELSDPMLHDDNGGLRAQVAGHDWLSEELVSGMRRHGRSLPPGRRMYEWAELLPYALADEVVFTNEHQREVMLRYCADRELVARAREVSRVSHHPIPAPDLYELSPARVTLEPGVVHLGFFGTFYASRGMAEVVGALRELAPEERSRLRLHVFTNKHPAVELEVLEHGLADVVRVRSMQGFLAYLKLTTLFDVLLVNDYAVAGHVSPNPYLPAKVADYLGSGRPIWSIVEPGSVLSGIETTYRSTLGDVSGARAVLRELLDDQVVRPRGLLGG